MTFQPPPAAPPPTARPAVHQTRPVPPGRAAWAPPPQAHRPEVTAGTLITRTLEVWWRNVGKLVLLSLVMMVPILVVVAGMAGGMAALGLEGGGQADPARFAAVIGAFTAVMLLVLLPLAMLILGGVNYGVIRWLAGQPAGVGDMLSQGARRIWGLILAALLVMLAVMGGYLLLIVPGIMVAVATCVALPAVTVERIGAVDAFKRSLELTRGYRWSLFAAFLAMFGLNFVTGLVGGLLGLIPLLGIVLNLGITLVFASLPYVLPAVAYHDLRVAKEGVDTTQLARVFE